MDTKLTLKQVLEKGIQKEIQAQSLYYDLCHKVKEEAAQDALQKLARQEKGHQILLEQYLLQIQFIVLDLIEMDIWLL